MRDVLRRRVARRSGGRRATAATAAAEAAWIDGLLLGTPACRYLRTISTGSWVCACVGTSTYM